MVFELFVKRSPKHLLPFLKYMIVGIIRAAKRQVDSCLVSILPALLTFNNKEDQTNFVQAETKQERIQLERNEKKFDLIQTVQQEYQNGKKKSVLAKEFDLNTRTITKYLKTANSPLVKPRGKRKRQTAEFHEQIEELERKGHTIKQIYSIIRDYGYTGTLSGVRVAVESIRSSSRCIKKRKGVGPLR